MKKYLLIGACFTIMAGTGWSRADSFGIYGSTTVSSSPPAFKLTSNASGPESYSGLYFQPTPGTLTLNDLTQLSADYEMTTGTFGAGSPRFSIIDTTNNTNNEAYIYFGTPNVGGTFTDPNFGSTQLNSTGNYAASSDLRVENNGFGGGSTHNTYETFAQFVHDFGSTQIQFISLDLDGGFAGDQVMLANNFQVNDATFSAPAPAPLPSSALGGAMLLAMLGGQLINRRRLILANLGR